MSPEERNVITDGVIDQLLTLIDNRLAELEMRASWARVIPIAARHIVYDVLPYCEGWEAGNGNIQGCFAHPNYRMRIELTARLVVEDLCHIQ